MTSHEDNPVADNRSVPPVADSGFSGMDAPAHEAPDASGDMSEGAKMRERIARHVADATLGEAPDSQEVATSPEAIPFRDAMAEMLRAQTAWQQGDATAGASRVVHDFAGAHRDILASEDINALQGYATAAETEAQDMQESEFKYAAATSGVLRDTSHKLKLLYNELLEARKEGRAIDPDRILRNIDEVHQYLEDASRVHAQQSQAVYDRQQLIDQEKAVVTGVSAPDLTYQRVRPIQ